MRLATPVSELKGAGEKTVELLRRLRIATVKDLLWHIPFRYLDASSPRPIKGLRLDVTAVVSSKIKKLAVYRTPKKKLSVVEARVADKSGEIDCIWFNQLYLRRFLRVGAKKIFVGTVKYDFNKKRKILQSPLILDRTAIKPIYHETKGLNSRKISELMQKVDFNIIEEFFTSDILSRYGLLERRVAFRRVHFPKDLKEIAAARRRLAFEELVLLALSLRSKEKKPAAEPIKIKLADIKKMLSRLPFRLTDAQRKASWQILKDIEKEKPMRRLLLGDVGSGKTIVAAIAALSAIKSGYQVLFLAPTEVLAKQHFNSFSKYFANLGIKPKLYTSDKKTADPKKDSLIIGTHALLNESINYGKVGLVVVDEQHRFGVKQRSALLNFITPLPHFLSMSATPIPRTLAHVLYGDLSISVIDELPLNRKKIKSLLVNLEQREAVFSRMKKEIRKGRQVFVITPRIEEEPNLQGELFGEEVTSVKQEYLLIKKNFPDCEVAMLHGKMASAVKEKVMRNFRKNKINILVSTSVIEVGVDVPNATVMVVEGAENFGLAALHQFRGRVGRSNFQSYFYLLTAKKDEKTLDRLKALERHNSGSALAEIDLQKRGPGSLVGLKQSGFPDLKIARLTDNILLRRAKEAADYLVAKGLSAKIKKEMLFAAETDHLE